jgi:hypothetical protein
MDRLGLDLEAALELERLLQHTGVLRAGLMVQVTLWVVE